MTSIRKHGWRMCWPTLLSTPPAGSTNCCPGTRKQPRSGISSRHDRRHLARLKITLDHVKPAVQRRVEVPLTIRLDRLHLVFLAARGWTNSHLYEIRARDVSWGRVDPDWGDGPLDAAKSRLIDVMEDSSAKTPKYLDGFGDGWEHIVKIERIPTPCPACHTRP